MEILDPSYCALSLPVELVFSLLLPFPLFPEVVRPRPLEAFFEVLRDDEPPDVERPERDDAWPPFRATAFFVVSLADAKPLFDVELFPEIRLDDDLLRDDVPLLPLEPLLEL